MEEHAEVVGPDHDGKDPLPKGELEESDSEEPGHNPKTCISFVFDLNLIHSSLIVPPSVWWIVLKCSYFKNRYNMTI